MTDGRSVQDLLYGWARWRWSGHGANVGYPSQAAFMREARQAGSATVRLPQLPDEVALRVDAAVSALKVRSHPVKGDYRWQVLTDAYLSGWTDRLVARKRHISRSTARTARLAAESWIEGYMS
jgi:hypothetical protein